MFICVLSRVTVIALHVFYRTALYCSYASWDTTRHVLENIFVGAPR